MCQLVTEPLLLRVLHRTMVLLTNDVYVCRELGSDWEATRLEALRWISVLLERHRTEVSGSLYYSRLSSLVHEYQILAHSCILWLVELPL